MGELTFPIEEYEHRLRRLRTSAVRHRVDLVLVTAPRDVEWGVEPKVRFATAESPMYWVVPVVGDPVVVMRHLEADTAQGVPYKRRVYYDEGNPWDSMGAVMELIKEQGWQDLTIGMDMRDGKISPNHYLQLADEFAVRNFSTTRVRIQRSHREIAKMDLAARVNQEATRETLQAIALGWSEMDVQQYVRERHRFWYHYLGGDEEDIETVMGATVCQIGAVHMREMHAERTLREMMNMKIDASTPSQEGMWLEPGCFIDNYPGSILRTVWLSSAPSEVERAVHACIEALARLQAVMAPGKRADEVDAAARGFLRRKGYDIDQFKSRSGYTSSEGWVDGGIVSLTPNNAEVLMPGMVFHCPIHVCLPHYGHVGVSWQLLVTENGCRPLGNPEICPLKLYVVG